MPATVAPSSPAELFESCRRLAHWIANRYARRHPHLADDLESDSLLALWLAALGHDPAEDGPFQAHAGKAVSRACRGCVARARRRFARQLVEDLDGGRATPLDLAEGREPEPGADLVAAELLARLPPRARAVAELRLEGRTFEEIGEAAGVTGPAVRDVVKRAARRAGVR